MLWILALLAAAPANEAPKKHPTLIQYLGHMSRPKVVAPSAERLSSLKAPEGFAVERVTTGLGDARMMVFADNGWLYLSRTAQGDVLALKLEGARVVAQKQVLVGRKNMHGLALHDGELFAAAERALFAAKLLPDGGLGPVRTVMNDLPPGGRHPRRTIGFDPEGRLYLSIGSDCNDCAKKPPELATILRSKADGSERTIFARGLRNTIGFDWEPTTHALWGMDHGIDGLGEDEPPEELNLLVEGGDYGWPFVYGDRHVITGVGTPPGGSLEDYAAKTTPPVLGYQAHSAPIWMLFYQGQQFPETYRGDAFVAMHGSWNRKTPVGYKVVRIHFERGQPVRFEDFVTGFLSEDGKTCFARPAGLTVAPDGSLLISDDTQGAIYRVRYVGAEKQGDAAPGDKK